MLPRFLVPDLEPERSTIELPRDEAQHLARVLRLGAGARVRVFDGRGGEWEAEVIGAHHNRATVRLRQPVSTGLEARIPITLVMSVLKSEQMDNVVRDSVMLGVTGLRPIVSVHGEVPLGTVKRSARLDRWKRIAVASAKQCGRAVVPTIHEAQSFREYLASPVLDGGVRLMMVEPGLPCEPRAARDVAVPSRADVMIGPVGGWDGEEVAAAIAAGAIPVRLGARTLRAERAPTVAIATLQALWDDL